MQRNYHGPPSHVQPIPPYIMQLELDEAQHFYESAAARAAGGGRRTSRWGAMNLLDRLVDEAHRPAPGMNKCVGVGDG